jgi:uncharacterized membrane protein
MRAEWLATVLSLAGLVPFYVSVAAIWQILPGDWEEVGWYILQSYGAIILSFLAGIHWGRALGAQNLQAAPLLLWSNIIALVAWVALFVAQPLVLLSLMMACFALQYAVDARMVARGILPQWYLPLRRGVTLGVMLACFLAMAALFH